MTEPFETLDGYHLDLVIAGTGIEQSLVVLALSKSGKKILHIDKNAYYGGAQAALSLQEAEKWTKDHAADGTPPFRNASISSTSSSILSVTRSYSLSLAPDLIYTTSALLPVLVSSKLHEQIEFQAVGSWFVLDKGNLLRVPNSREDIFADTSLDVRAKGTLVRFLRLVADFEQKTEIWEPYKDAPIEDFLGQHFKISANLQKPILALTMSKSSITTEKALQRIARHLRSMGVFGPGFAAVVPKWGGLSEIIQTSCRAGAVGGAIYMLNRSVKRILPSNDEEMDVVLDNDDVVKTSFVIGTDDQLPDDVNHSTDNRRIEWMTRSISIVPSKLSALFPPLTAEGGPTPSVAVVVASTSSNPVHLMVHSSDTGECPSGQCIIYASVALANEQASPMLHEAVDNLLATAGDEPPPSILWQLTYEQQIPQSTATPATSDDESRTIRLTEPFPGPVYDEEILRRVLDVWQRVKDHESSEFMKFDDTQEMEEEDVDNIS